MFNKTAQQPETLNEQYNSGYFDKDEYITRLSIDMVMDNAVLSFEHTEIDIKNFTYSREDLIDETMHKEDSFEALSALCHYKNIEKLRTDYLNFLIEEAGDYIESQIDKGYYVEIE